MPGTDSWVKAFLGTPNKVYIIDKVENNPQSINGHPAWASGKPHSEWPRTCSCCVEYALDTNTARAMDIVTNTFCAGGNVLANGTWVNVGGNQGVTFGGNVADSQSGGPPYDDPDGGQSCVTITLSRAPRFLYLYIAFGQFPILQ